VVTTGPRVGENWLIETGLRPGDRVIVEGLLIARPGLTVNPRPYHEKPAPGAAKAQ
jgi:membrane fusion protein (multidrug efflux system)